MVEERKKPKVSIIGAGAVGIRYAYSLMIKGLARSIVILDKNQEKAQGEVMDLNHGMPYISPVEVTVGKNSNLAGSDLVVITAGAKQKPGQTRIDLIKENIQVFRSIIPGIMEYAADAIFLVVTNPVDVLSYATCRISGKSWHQVIGSGCVLDSARFRYLLSQHCRIDARNIHAYILGEHGDTEFPVWSRVMIGGILFDNYCPVCGRCKSPKLTRNSIFESVRDSAYKIIEKKGETSYGIGLALVRITQAILKDENAVLPVSTFVDGDYGIHDVYLSLPCVVNKLGIREVLNIVLDDEEISKLRHSAEAIKAVIRDSGL
ncbi:MAG: L-lactate dehydrogenase [Candidatus Aureabacteria bacterium]|nr:L-lactate dehydrogenase [Candidatus Auribacterota bacterium]